MTWLVKYRGVGANTGNANNATITVPFPASLAAGDLMVMPVQFSTTAGVLATPANWTLFKKIDGTNQLNDVYIYWKIATAADVSAGSVDVVPSGGSAGHGLYGGCFAVYDYNWTCPMGLMGTVMDSQTTQKNSDPIPAVDSSKIRNGALVVVGARDTGGTAKPVLSGDGLTWQEVIDYSSAGTHNLLAVDIGIWQAQKQLIVTDKTFVWASGTGKSVGMQFLINGQGDGFSGWIVDTRGPTRRILPKDKSNFKLRQIIDDALASEDV